MFYESEPPPKLPDVCPVCKAQFVVGKAIDPGEPSRCFHTPETITADTLKLVDVFKCSSCGHSDDGVYR